MCTRRVNACPDDLITRQKAITHLKTREGDRILYDLDLRLDARGLTIVRAMCEVVLEVQRRELRANSHTRGTLPSEEEDRTRDQPDDPSKGIEQDIDEEEDPSEEAHRAVGVSTEGNLREELPDEEDQ